MELWTLLGIGVVVLGFGLRVNPLIVIAAAAGLTGWTAGLSPVTIIEAFGKAFATNRFVSVVFLPVYVLIVGSFVSLVQAHALREIRRRHGDVLEELEDEGTRL